MPVKIISDSTCDLSQDLLRKYDIEVAPLTVTLGNRSGPDGAEITPEDIYRYVETSGQLPKTSAVNLMAYEALFRKWREKGFESVRRILWIYLTASVQKIRDYLFIRSYAMKSSTNLSNRRCWMMLSSGLRQEYRHYVYQHREEFI